MQYSRGDYIGESHSVQLMVYGQVSVCKPYPYDRQPAVVHILQVGLALGFERSTTPRGLTSPCWVCLVADMPTPYTPIEGRELGALTVAIGHRKALRRIADRGRDSTATVTVHSGRI